MEKIIKLLLVLSICCSLFAYSSNTTTIYANEDTAIASTLKEGLNEVDGEYIYIRNGEQVFGELVEIDGYTYFFDYEYWGGYMIRDATYELYYEEIDTYVLHAFDKNGRMIKNDWYGISYNMFSLRIYLDANGAAVTGVKTIDGKRYLFNDWGYLQVNTEYIIDKTVYVTDEEGIIVKEVVLKEGLNQVNDSSYYVKNGEVVYYELVEINGYTYFFDYNGKMLKNDVAYNVEYVEELDDYCHYGFDSDGKMIYNDWLTDRYGDTYYFDNNGRAVDGIQTINGKMYAFEYSKLCINDAIVIDSVVYVCNEQGVVVNSGVLEEGLNEIGNYTYYVEDGEYVDYEFIEIDGYEYYFKGNGQMAKDEMVYINFYDYTHQSSYYLFDESGKRILGWYTDSDNNTYYFGEYGAAADDVSTINGEDYLFDRCVLYKSNCLMIDDKLYISDSEGKVTGEYDIVYGLNTINGNKYLIEDIVVKDEWVYVSDLGEWCYFNEQGILSDTYDPVYTLKAGDSINVVDFVPFYDIYTFDTLVYESEDETIATIDKQGNIKGLKEGTTTITINAGGYRDIINGGGIRYRQLTMEIELTVSSTGLPFTDIHDYDWYKDYVAQAYNLGLMTGASDTLFKPTVKMNRGMVAIVLHRMEGAEDVEFENIFPDVKKGEYYAESVIWAKSNGIINGYGNGTFRPLKEVTREEMAQMIYNFAKYKEVDVSADVDLSTFLDGNKVSSWHKDAMMWANANGLITGKYNGTKLDPQGTASRAECCKMLVEAYKTIYK